MKKNLNDTDEMLEALYNDAAENPSRYSIGEIRFIFNAKKYFELTTKQKKWLEVIYDRIDRRFKDGN